MVLDETGFSDVKFTRTRREGDEKKVFFGDNNPFVWLFTIFEVCSVRNSKSVSYFAWVDKPFFIYIARVVCYLYLGIRSLLSFLISPRLPAAAALSFATLWKTKKPKCSRSHGMIQFSMIFLLFFSRLSRKAVVLSFRVRNIHRHYYLSSNRINHHFYHHQ